MSNRRWHHSIPIPTIFWWLQLTWIIGDIIGTIRFRDPSRYRDEVRQVLLDRGEPITEDAVNRELVNMLRTFAEFRSMVPKFRIWTRKRFVTMLANNFSPAQDNGVVNEGL
jgi:hypothetical protein